MGHDHDEGGHDHGVDSIDDLHTWQICSELTIATVHLRASADTVDTTDRIRRDVHDQLAAAGVDHATVELLHSEHTTRLDAHTH